MINGSWDVATHCKNNGMFSLSLVSMRIPKEPHFALPEASAV